MKRIFSKIRFLPLTIFAATLMLTVKIGDIWDGFDGLINGTIHISEAVKIILCFRSINNSFPCWIHVSRDFSDDPRR